jgi:hypothetical protein
MKTIVWVRAPLIVVAVSVSSLAQADFSGPYATTPPTPGRYNTSGLALPYGNWLAYNVNGIVDTTGAPLQLQLESPSFGIFPNVLRFETLAAGSGTVSFDYTTVSRFNVTGGGISWFWQPAGGNRTYIPLDQGLNNQLRHFDFQVQAGGQFGFRIISGSDVVNPGEPLLHILTVENFTAPIPEPSVPLLTVIGCLLLGARYARRCSDSAYRRS